MNEVNWTYLINNNQIETVENLLKNGISANHLESGIPLLNFAIMAKNKEMIKLLINHGADPSLKNNDEVSALHLAAIHSQDDSLMIELLKAKKISDINVKNKTQSSALLNAIAFGNEKAALSLINHGVEIENNSFKSTTPLMAAAKKVMPEVVRRLLQLGADINAKDIYGVSVLMSVCKNFELSDERGRDLKKCMQETFDVLWSDEFRSRINFKHVADSGATAFSEALKCGNLKIAEKIAQEWFDPNQYSPSGTHKKITPLMLMCHFGMTELIQKSIERGVRVNETNEKGESALMYALNAKNEKGEPLKKEKINENVKILLEAGAQLDNVSDDFVIAFYAFINEDEELMQKLKNENLVGQKNKEGMNVLGWAIKARDKKNVFSLERLIKEFQLKINEPQINGATPLSMLIQEPITQKRKKEIESLKKNKLMDQEVINKQNAMDLFKGIKELLSLGADINAKDEEGRTALWHSLMNIPPLLVQYLVQNGGDERVRDNNEISPLMLASMVPEKHEIFEEWIQKESNKEDVKSFVYDLVWTSGEVDSEIQMLNKPLEKAISFGAQLEYQDEEGQTPLIVAVAQNKEPFVNWLISKGVNLNQSNNEGETALFQAVANNHPNLVVKLCESGANPFHQRKDGMDILGIAFQRRNTACLNAIHEAMANWNKQKESKPPKP